MRSHCSPFWTQVKGGGGGGTKTGGGGGGTAEGKNGTMGRGGPTGPQEPPPQPPGEGSGRAQSKARATLPKRRLRMMKMLLLGIGRRTGWARIQEDHAPASTTTAGVGTLKLGRAHPLYHVRLFRGGDVVIVEHPEPPVRSVDQRGHVRDTLTVITARW